MTPPSLTHRFDELLRHRRLPWLALGLILAVFALAIGHVTLRMRADVQRQILNRDAEVLHAMVMMQFAEVATETGVEVREPVDQWTVLLKASRLRSVLAARLFDAQGQFDTGIPLDVTDGGVSESDRRQVLASRPVTEFRPDARRSEVFEAGLADTSDSVLLPFLIVTVPFQAAPDAEVVGIGQFVLAGESLAREFAALDRGLAGQALVIFLAGAAIIGASLGWSFRRLQRTHRDLAARTRDLLRANEELARAARTAAIGSVAAHLIHGLKNPLSGLDQFVRDQTAAPRNGDDPLWRDAAASTRRMRELVAEVVRVLREEETGDAYEITPAELVDLVCRRVEPLARAAGVSLRLRVDTDKPLDNRRANLLQLILANLLQNAVQASPRDGEVCLTLRHPEGRLLCEVADGGPGLPGTVRENLFAPCQSTREGGTGLGLAISKQLAQHLGAELRLERTSAAGTVFLLELPTISLILNP